MAMATQATASTFAAAEEDAKENNESKLDSNSNSKDSKASTAVVDPKAAQPQEKAQRQVDVTMTMTPQSQSHQSHVQELDQPDRTAPVPESVYVSVSVPANIEAKVEVATDKCLQEAQHQQQESGPKPHLVAQTEAAAAEADTAMTATAPADFAHDDDDANKQWEPTLAAQTQAETATQATASTFAAAEEDAKENNESKLDSNSNSKDSKASTAVVDPKAAQPQEKAQCQVASQIPSDVQELDQPDQTAPESV